MKKTTISRDQIKGRIATLESELGALEREHAKDQEAFQKKTAERSKRHNEITGSIAALKDLVS